MPVTTVLPEYRPQQSASQAHIALKQAVLTMDQARHCAVLWFADILARRLYTQLGYASIQLYASKELGFSSTRTGDFVRLARKLDDLPTLKRSLAKGKIGYTKVREIIKVATPATEKAWLKAANSMPRHQLEQKVAQARRQAVTQHYQPGQTVLHPTAKADAQLVSEIPVRVQLEMTPEQFARYEALLELLSKRGTTGKRVDRILEGLELLAQPVQEAPAETQNGLKPTVKKSEKTTPPRPTPRGTPFQIHVHQCPDCGQFSVPSSRGELHLGSAEIERILCDARIDDPRLGIPNKHTITPTLRRQVMARDGHHCQVPGCANTRFLEVHHVVPRAKGGSNSPENLVTLCSACHRHIHRHQVQIWQAGHLTKPGR